MLCNLDITHIIHIANTSNNKRSSTYRKINQSMISMEQLLQFIKVCKKLNNKVNNSIQFMCVSEAQ